jgi:WD40 repeat protein/serine/threonine protein kinase
MVRTTDPSRDLLFGLLALQTGLINQAQLVAAFHAWTQARNRSMAEILSEQGALETPCLTLVEGLVIEHLRRHGSDPERSLAAIGVGRSTRECLAQIGNPRLDASLAQVGSGSTEHDFDPDRTTSYAVGTGTSDGQRFRVLRPHAQGGLGAVFVALDTELNREVALKQILEKHTDDPDSRARFLLEAEITGRLEHPGVVPVYGLGCDAQGRPFYAMRFVKGQSLKEAIARFHDAENRDGSDPRQWNLALRQLLNRFVAVCNVIAYVHSRGVIHRDLKPANILLGPYGETLVVDWGLAKVVGRGQEAAHAGAVEVTLQPGSSSNETLPGTALGTPAYMSPEQAEGRLGQVGPLSDIYSLGATLYGLLTGKPPLEGAVGEVLGRAQRGEFPPPRKVNQRVPPALEAVCLKAMATKPEDRYPSSRVLAEDLEHWLADEPVTAHREPWHARLARWGRRHKPAVAAAGVLLVVAVIALAVGTALIRSEQRQTQRQRDLAEKRADSLDRQLYINRVNLAYRECLANNIASAERLLDGCPESRRGWEWHYTRRLCHLESLAIPRDVAADSTGIPADDRPTVAIAPDGKRIVSTRGAMVILWDPATGREVGRLRGSGPYFCFAFRPDGRWLAAGGKGLVTLWEVESGNLVRTLSGHTDDVTGLAFSPDGRRIAACTSTGIEASHLPETKVWDAEGGQELATFGERRWGAQNLVFSPDGRRIALVLNWRPAVYLLDAATARNVGTLSAPTDHGYTSAAFSPDGRWIAASCGDGSVVLWDVAAMSFVRLFRGHTRYTNGVAFSPDGRRIASASDDATIRLWETATGREVATLRGHDGAVTSVRFGPGGSWLASAGRDRTIRVWEVAAPGDSLTLRGNGGWAFRTQFAPGGRLVTAGFGVVSVRDPVTGKTIRDIRMPGGGVQGLALSPDGRRVAAAREFLETFDLWDIADGRRLATFRGHAGRVRGLAFCPDGRQIASASDDATVRLWDAATGREVRALRGHPGGAFAVAYHPGGRRLASIGWDGTVRLWDPETGAELRVLRGIVQRQSVTFGNAVAFSPDGRRLAAASDDGRVVVWDAETGALVLTLAGYDAEVNGLAFDPSGRRIASASEDSTIRLWDAVTGEEVFTLRGHVAPVLGVAFSPDGMRIASASEDMTVKIWDLARPAPDVSRRRGASP